MYRYTYDSDISVFSPKGRLLQVEYAQEAVKQGSAVTGLCSKTHVVLVAFKRSLEDLAAHQNKLFKIDDHICIGVSGLMSDARVLSNYMTQRSMSSKMVFARPIPAKRILNEVALKAQTNTQFYGRRPYGVGFLLAGSDESGPHLHEFSPNGTTFEYHAMAIGARSQSAKTYLEKHFESFPECSVDELIHHGLLALRDTLPKDVDLDTSNTAVSVVGPPLNTNYIQNQTFELDTSTQRDEEITEFSHTTLPPPTSNLKIMEGDSLESYISKLGPRNVDEPTEEEAAAAATTTTSTTTSTSSTSIPAPAPGTTDSSAPAPTQDGQDSMETD